MKKFGMMLLVSSLALAACTPPLDPPTNTQIRFVNAVGDSTSMNVFYGQDKKNTSAVGFRGVFPGTDAYSTVPSGSVKYSLCLDDLLDCSKKDQTIDVAKDEPKTVVLVGTKSTADDAGATPRPLEIVSFGDKTAIPGEGKAKIRVIHAASVAGANKIDLYITEPGAALNGFPPALEYKAAYDYREVSTATQQRLRVTSPGVTSSLLVDSGPLTLVAGKVYTAVIFNPDAGGLGITLLTDK
jgi:Domain of unknown function (DUF4397)